MGVWQTIIDFFSGPPTETDNVVVPTPDVKTAYTETKTETASPPADDVDRQQHQIAIDLATGGPLFPL